LVWGGWFSSLLAEHTKLQASVERALTDTVRDITFEDINTFTADAVGAFTVLDNSYSAVTSKRLFVDLVQTISSKRKDQLLLGVSLQKDDFVDAQSGLNGFVRVLEPGGAQSTVRRDQLPPDAPFFCDGSTSCEVIQPDKRQSMQIFTLGYRYRLRSWLAIQLRGTHFNRSEHFGARPFLQLASDGTYSVVTPEDPADVLTHYFSIDGGLVLNLRVF